MPPSADRNTLLSVVIIGLNEAARIGVCIDSVKTAVSGIADTEIVYIDSGSLDGTISVALSKGVKVFQLGQAQPPSPAAGRYVGSLVTHGRFIMFVDGDTRIAPGWVEPALKLMERDGSIVMFSGISHHSTKGEGVCLTNMDDLGIIRSVYRTGGDNAPIVLRASLETAGNWNPFVKCREEEDLAIRLRHYVRGSRICQSTRGTVDTPKCPIFAPAELLRRCKRGFVKGPGQILRNAIAHGYWRECARVSKPIFLVIALLVGLGVTIAVGLWWQFLLLFFGASFLRACATRKFIRLASIFYSLLLGMCSLWELLTVRVRTAADYVCDFEEMHTNHRDELGVTNN